MHSEYQHPSIQLYMMSLKASYCRVDEIDCHGEEAKPKETKQISNDNDNDNDSDSNSNSNSNNHDVAEGDFEGSALLNLKGKQISEWEARRYGAMAAKLLRDVKIT